MIFRVRAVYKQSRIILGILLLPYTVDLIVYLIDRIMFSTKNKGM